MGQGVGGIERDRFFECVPGIGSAELGQGRKTQRDLGPPQLGRQRHGFLRRVGRLLRFTQHQLQLGQSRPCQCIFGLLLYGQQARCRVPR